MVPTPLRPPDRGAHSRPAIAVTELGKQDANAAGEIDSRDTASLDYRIGMKM